jgi:hypothetical protein
MKGKKVFLILRPRLGLVFLLFGTHTVFAQHEHSTEAMQGMYGQYPMSREASGTSWQPDSTPLMGKHFTRQDWNLMLHGVMNLVYDKQGGKRGNSKVFSSSMFSFMADKKNSQGKLGLRSMFSLDPLMGKRGYPSLLQTGETYDGINPLIDRQHPHDFFAELAASYSYPLSEEASLFTYFGLPGEPALGPPVYVHRLSGMDIPEAPLGHHWLDSTHITFGVGTLGYIWENWKLEASIFRGREPDERRWDIERPTFDSYSARLSWNPNPDWAFQVSFGDLDSPEQLEPTVDMKRYTASAIYNRPLNIGNWQTTFAWGMNDKEPGINLHAFLLESALKINKHTFITRFERTEKDELFEHDNPLAGKAYPVRKITAGYVCDFLSGRFTDFGVGATVSASLLPETLEAVYSDTPVSYMVFMRLKL